MEKDYENQLLGSLDGYRNSLNGKIPSLSFKQKIGPLIEAVHRLADDISTNRGETLVTTEALETAQKALNVIIDFQKNIYAEFDLALNEGNANSIIAQENKIEDLPKKEEEEVGQLESKITETDIQLTRSLNLIAKFYKYNYEDKLSKRRVSELNNLFFRTFNDYVSSWVDLLIAYGEAQASEEMER